MIYRISKDSDGFPDPRDGHESGLFAVGGDLSLRRLCIAYSNGIFPWYDYKKDKEIEWFCPMQRFVIDTNNVHVSHSMRQELKKDRYTIDVNSDFEKVVDYCATAQGRDKEDGAWLGPEIKEAMMEMHRRGVAWSFEVKEQGELVGGLYGIKTSNIFIGESMFSLKPNTSKIALIAAASILYFEGVKIIDCQMETEHLKSMGGHYISYDEYMKIMNEGYTEDGGQS